VADQDTQLTELGQAMKATPSNGASPAARRDHGQGWATRPHRRARQGKAAINAAARPPAHDDGGMDTARSTVIRTATDTSARRADAGSVRLSDRDVAGLRAALAPPGR
jgi:hypothetical protein